MPDRLDRTLFEFRPDKGKAPVVIVYVEFVECEIRRGKSVGQIRTPPQNHVIHAHDAVSKGQEAVSQVAADKPGDAGNKALRVVHDFAFKPTPCAKVQRYYQRQRNSQAGEID